MSERINMVGWRFGRLTVIGFDGLDNRGAALWRCRCDCGTERTIRGGRLRSGTSKSCGCLRKELMTTHGGTNTRLYNIWEAMRGRCNNPNNKCYKDYGGRGITVCDEWKSDFTAFRDWALQHGYQDDLSIDRIDNDKGYTPENCRWATAEQQSNNRRNNIVAEIDGQKKTIGQWAHFAGIPGYMLYDRWNKGIRGHDLIRPVVKEAKLAV